MQGFPRWSRYGDHSECSTWSMAQITALEALATRAWRDYRALGTGNY